MWGKLLSLDEETGAMAVLAKLDEGFHEPRHTHLSDAHVMVLEGKLVDEKVGEIQKRRVLVHSGRCGTRSRIFA